MEFYAKSVLPDETQPTVKEHLDAVARYAEQYGKECGGEMMGKEAAVAGQYHDFGKYSESFQQVLRGTKTNVDHAFSSAVYLYAKAQVKQRTRNYESVIEVVNGHHDVLMPFSVFRPFAEENWKSARYETPQHKEAALQGKDAYISAGNRFQEDHPGYKRPALAPPCLADSLTRMLYTRMLFSCLVDADYSVSAHDEQPDYFDTSEITDFDVESALKTLYGYRNRIAACSHADPELNRMRDEVFEKCGNCGETSPAGLFTLTAPTGTGKTLALLHFALRHCLSSGKKRIILVLPFLTLAEQSTDIYQKIVPDVLVDHSQSRLDETAREFSARWRVPFIVTTSVKFFESLFASRPMDCRKLHHIADSVVVFDEAQTLPPELATAALRSVLELCSRFGTTMVFSTATQPDFSQLPVFRENGLWKPTEILPDYPRYYRALKRTEVEWRLDDPCSSGEIAAEMQKQAQVCAIFNTRHYALEAYRVLAEEDSLSAFLISTDLCPAHRSRVIAEVRERLENGLPCRVASTQCIEAGVDLDFPAMFRALAPLDAVIQAAGRCNRNGKAVTGKVIVFEQECDGKRCYPSDWYERAAVTVNRLVRENGLDIHNPEDIHRYYAAVLPEVQDKPTLTKAIEGKDYRETDEEFRMIDQKGFHIIVPYACDGISYRDIREELLTRGITPALMKQAAPITVSSYGRADPTYLELVYLRIKGKRSDRESGYYILRKQYESLYTDKTGLQFPPTCTQTCTSIW